MSGCRHMQLRYMNLFTNTAANICHAETTLIALLEFPSAEAVKAFATDPKYAPYAVARQAGSESRFQLIDDTDLAGTIPYLPKG